MVQAQFKFNTQTSFLFSDDTFNQTSSFVCTTRSGNFNRARHNGGEWFVNSFDNKQSLSINNTSATKQNRSNVRSQNLFQRFSHLISVLPTAVLVIDNKGLITLANQQAKSLLGEPLVNVSWRQIIAQVFSPKADDGHEVSMRNGKRVKIDISPLVEEKGQLIVITDLTETRELQSRVSHMQRLSSLGKMVASLAHQVRTPLASALLYAENLKSMAFDQTMVNGFSEKLCLRLKELESQVNDMLLFAKSSDNQIIETLHTKDLIETCVAQVESQFQRANITLEAKCINDASIVGNKTALLGALGNLLMNALQALTNSSNEHPKLVQISAQTQTLQGQDFIRFRVSDNGKGLSEKLVKKLFEPFFTTKSQGTGLGLAVVQTVAKSHKGSVNCGNNQAGGAFFDLNVPLQTSPQKNTMQHVGAAI